MCETTISDRLKDHISFDKLVLRRPQNLNIMVFIRTKISRGIWKIVDRHIKPERPIVLIIITLPFGDNKLLDQADIRSFEFVNSSRKRRVDRLVCSEVKA